MRVQCVRACAREPSQNDSDVGAGLGDAGVEDSLPTRPRPQSDAEEKEAGPDVPWLLPDTSLGGQSREGWPQGVGPADPGRRQRSHVALPFVMVQTQF